MDRTIHRYSFRSLLPDYVRGGAGLAVAVGFWALSPDATHIVVIFGGLTVLFLLFTMRTAARQRTRVEMTDDAIASAGFRRVALRWRELERVRLRYYSTRRNRSGGWMNLQLRGGGGSITVDSYIEGFEAIAARAARSIVDNRLSADDVTLANLAALGCETAAAGPVAGSTP